MKKKVFRKLLIIKEFFVGMPKSDVVLNWVCLGVIILFWGIAVFLGHTIGFYFGLVFPVFLGGGRIVELVLLYQTYLEGGRHKRYSSADYAVPIDGPIGRTYCPYLDRYNRNIAFF